MRAQEDGSAGKSMKQNTSGYLLALLAVVIWSGNFVVARAVADMIPPWQCNFWRWFTAFVTILPFAWRHLREDWPALRRHWRFVVVMSLLGVTLMNTFFYKAGQSTESLNMALIAPTAPIIILIFSRLLYGEAITPRRLLGMLVVATGIVILVSRGDMERLAALRFAPGASSARRSGRTGYDVMSAATGARIFRSSASVPPPSGWGRCSACRPCWPRCAGCRPCNGSLPSS